MKKYEVNPLSILLIAVIAIVAVLSGVYAVGIEEFQTVMDKTIHALFPLIGHVLELIGVGVIAFGSGVILVWFVRAKLADPYKPSGVAPYFSRYLTLSLEFLIGAEIIKTSIIRTWEEFSLLILVIVSRGLLGFIIHLEGKWGKLEENQPQHE